MVTSVGAVGVANVGARTAAPLASLVPADWRKALSAEITSSSFQNLGTFIDAQSQKVNVYPPRAEIFAALKHTPIKNVKVVIIGQDPYPTKGDANGLSFSVSPGQKIPGSLKNIFEGLHEDTGLPVPKSGDLSPWADQGVLLLNTVLTVTEGKPNSHHNKGWEPFTEAVLKKVNEQPGPVIFLCFGKQATDMATKLIDTKKHTILSEPHPSPLNGTKFVDSVAKDHLFTKTNQLLTKGGRTAVDWKLP